MISGTSSWQHTRIRPYDRREAGRALAGQVERGAQRRVRRRCAPSSFAARAPSTSRRRWCRAGASWVGPSLKRLRVPSPSLLDRRGRVVSAGVARARLGPSGRRAAGIHDVDFHGATGYYLLRLSREAGSLLFAVGRVGDRLRRWWNSPCTARSPSCRTSARHR